MPSLNTPPSSPILEGAEQESCILVTHEVGVKYEVEVTHEQVRDYLGFLKSPGLTIT